MGLYSCMPRLISASAIGRICCGQFASGDNALTLKQNTRKALNGSPYNKLVSHPKSLGHMRTNAEFINCKYTRPRFRTAWNEH